MRSRMAGSVGPCGGYGTSPFNRLGKKGNGGLVLAILRPVRPYPSHPTRRLGQVQTLFGLTSEHPADCILRVQHHMHTAIHEFSGLDYVVDHVAAVRRVPEIISREEWLSGVEPGAGSP
jgi:hypothetical protein